MSFRYRLPYSVTLGPQQHSFLRYPPVPIRPLGSLPSSQASTFDTVLRWGFWMGVGFVAVQVVQKLIQKPALEGNARRSKAEMEALKARALELYVPGESVSPLAKELGVSVPTIINWVKEAGVYRPATRGVKPGSKHKKRRPVNPVRQQIIDSYKPGMNASKLARELGVSCQTLTNWLKKAGVYEPAPMGPPSFGQELRQEALNRYVPGEPISPLARDLGVSRQTLTDWLKEAGVYEPAPKAGRGRGGRPRNEELYQEALRRYVLGEPVGPLARQLGVSDPTIRNWMKAAGVYEPASTAPQRDEQLYQEALRRYVPGESVDPLARDLGVSSTTIIAWMKEAGVFKSARKGRPRHEKRQEALRRYVPGEPVPPLAKKLGVSPRAVIAWMKEAGVYEPAPKGSSRVKKQKEKSKFLELYEPGMNVSALAREIGVSLRTALDWAEETGEYRSFAGERERRRRRQEKKFLVFEKYKPGMSVAILARDVGVGHKQAMQWLKEAGVYVPAVTGPKEKTGPRNKELFLEALNRYVPGEPVTPLAGEIGVSIATFVNWMKLAGVYVPAEKGQRISESVKSALFESYRPTANLSELAREFGVSRAIAALWLEEAGIYIPAPMGGVRGPMGVPPEEKHRVLLDEYEPGMDVAELAKVIGISRKKAYEILRAEGVYVSGFEGATPAEKKEALFSAYTPAKNLKALAREIGIPYATAIRWLKKEKIYTPSPMGGLRRARYLRKKKEALRRYVPGEPVRPLAEEFGVDPTTIIKWIKEAGVYKPAPKERKKKK